MHDTTYEIERKYLPELSVLALRRSSPPYGRDRRLWYRRTTPWVRIWRTPISEPWVLCSKSNHRTFSKFVCLWLTNQSVQYVLWISSTLAFRVISLCNIFSMHYMVNERREKHACDETTILRYPLTITLHEPYHYHHVMYTVRWCTGRFLHSSNQNVLESASMRKNFMRGKAKQKRDACKQTWERLMICSKLPPKSPPPSVDLEPCARIFSSTSSSTTFFDRSYVNSSVCDKVGRSRRLQEWSEQKSHWSDKYELFQTSTATAEISNCKNLSTLPMSADPPQISWTAMRIN